MARTHNSQEGFLMMWGLFVLSTLLLLTGAGLNRSMTDLRVANRSIDLYGAFHLAEAASDEALQLLGSLPRNRVDDLLALPDDPPTTCAIGSCTFKVEDDAEADGDPQRDTNGIVIVKAEGPAVDATQRVRITVKLGQSIFDQGVMAWEIAMSGDAEIGEDGTRPVISARQKFTTGVGTDVYAEAVRFQVPITTGPGGSCPDCDDPTIFHPTPDLQGKLGASFVLPAAVTTLDLNPYYEQAIAECQAEGHTEASCQDGSAGSSHHIVADTTLAAGTTYDGIIYVEKGVNVSIPSGVTIYGTVVHEGYKDTALKGHLQISGTNVLIDSTSAGLAPGVAILGGPLFISTPASAATIKGFVMVGSTYSGGTPNAFGGDLTIEGSVISSCYFPTLLPNSPMGPGVDAVDWRTILHQITLSDSVLVKYGTPPRIPPGFGFVRPTILLWEME